MEVGSSWGKHGGARPRPGSSLSGPRPAAALAFVLLLAGCASPFVGEADEPDPVQPLPRELAARPQPLRETELEGLAVTPPSPTPSPTPSPEVADEGAGGKGGKGGKGGGKSGGKDGGKEKPSPPSPSPKPSPSPSPSPAPAPGPGPTLLGAAADPQGDAGLRAPAYADVLQVSLGQSGTAAIVTVDLAGAVPERLASGEVMGVGVDLFRTAAAESDYQLFADGSKDGWFAYLQGPDGFVDYPGSFRLGGSRMVFEVPWSALGDAASGSFRAFVDWSRKAVPLNEFGEDRAPDAGTASFSR